MSVIKSQKIYSPQRFVEALTGECYIFDDDHPVEEQIHRALQKHGVEDPNNEMWDYAFDEIEEVIENDVPVVLVDVSGYGPGEWQTAYRWFEIPDDTFPGEEDAQ